MKFGNNQWRQHVAGARHNNSPISEENVSKFLTRFNTFVKNFDIRMREGLRASRKVCLI